MTRGKLEMTIDEFVELKYSEKLPFTKIAEIKGVSDPTIHHWMKKHKEEIELALVSQQAEKTPSSTKSVQDNKKDEYERLIASLRNDLKESHTQLDEKDELIQSLQTTIEKYERVCGASQDADKEISRLKEDKDKLQGEYNKVVTNQYHKDYQVENQKKIIENLKKTMERYETENRAFRELLKLWI